jgi:dTDP-4-dehydrorhamnose reductase
VNAALVLGADGQLGTQFVKSLDGRCRVVGADVKEVDVCDARSLAKLTTEVQPDTIINCAAWNAVDQAEERPLDALYTNAYAVQTLANLAGELGATLVHFSTDFVFDGQTVKPYAETDQPRPISTYGMSKLLGEAACASWARHYVLRLSSLYGGHQRRSYVDHIASAVRAGRSVPVYEDRFVSPSYAPDVVAATLALLQRQAPFGLYHCVSSDFCSWYDVAVEVARQLPASPSCLEPVRFSNTPGRANRPQFCALSTGKLEACIGPMPGWKDALSRHLASW